MNLSYGGRFRNATLAIVLARQALLEMIRSSESIELLKTKGGKGLFSQTLRFAQQQRWVHYARLAQGVGLSGSQVHRWFNDEDDDKGFSFPSVPVRLVAFHVLGQILEEDIRRINIGEEPVGGYKP